MSLIILNTKEETQKNQKIHKFMIWKTHFLKIVL